MEMETHYPTGAEVKELRAQASKRLGYKVTARQAAAMIGVSSETWRAWEYERRAMQPIKVREFLQASSPSRPPTGEVQEAKKSVKTEPLADPERIKYYRVCAELTREEAAAIIGVTPRSWQSWETGARPMYQARLDQWKALASTLPTPEERSPTFDVGSYLARKVDRPAEAALRPMPDLPPKSEPPHDPDWEAQMAKDLEKPLVYEVGKMGARLAQEQRERDAEKLAVLEAFEARMAVEARVINE